MNLLNIHLEAYRCIHRIETSIWVVTKFVHTLLMASIAMKFLNANPLPLLCWVKYFPTYSPSVCDRAVVKVVLWKRAGK